MQTTKRYDSQVKYWLLEDFFHDIRELPYATIKGAALSKLCYNNESVRRFNDIDILIPKTSLKQIENILQQHNFLSINPERNARIFSLSASHQLPPFTKNIGNIYLDIDLNFDLFWGEYDGKRININEFLDDTAEVVIFETKLKTLPPLKAIIQLILHHYKEMNSIYHLVRHNCISYNMFKDVYYLWKNNQQEISLDKLYAACQKYQIIPYAYYILYFTNQIFKDNQLQEYVEAFKTSKGENLLNYYGLSDQERKPWKVDFQTRLEANNLLDLIKKDLTEEDRRKIELNKQIFSIHT